MMSSVNHDDRAHLKIPLENILSSTNNFDEENLAETADFGNAYTGQLLWSGELIKIIARRFNKDEWDDEKEQQFWMEISLLSTLKHKSCRTRAEEENGISLVGEDLENLYKLVKAKYESTRPVEDLDLILWGDLKIMFEPHIEDKIYMLVEKQYPLTPSTITMMLEKKLMIDHESEMAYQLLKFIMK
ncbi:hypothetical protein Tco_1098911 [Tanacetum coccineum]